LATAAAAALAIAFPPTWFAGASPPSSTAPAAVPAPPAQSPAPVAQSAPVPAAQAASSGIPVAGAVYSGSLPIGGQSAPLPIGRWIVIAVGTTNQVASPDPPAVSVFLAQVQGRRITGAAVITGSTVSDPKGAGFAAPLELQVPSYYYRRVIASVDHGKLDLWVCGTTQPARWNDPLRQAAAATIRKQGLSLPDRFDSTVFRLADARNWLSAEFMFPDPTPLTDPIRPWTETAALTDADVLPTLEKVRRWGKEWHEIVRRGFAGTLRQGDEALIAPP
jgi:hypothetical protein